MEVRDCVQKEHPVEKGKITIVDAAETAGMGVDALLKKKEEYERSGE